MLKYYRETGRIREIEKLLTYRNLREIREFEEQSTSRYEGQLDYSESEGELDSEYKSDSGDEFIELVNSEN